MSEFVFGLLHLGVDHSASVLVNLKGSLDRLGIRMAAPETGVHICDEMLAEARKQYVSGTAFAFMLSSGELTDVSTGLIQQAGLFDPDFDEDAPRRFAEIMSRFLGTCFDSGVKIVDLVFSDGHSVPGDFDQVKISIGEFHSALVARISGASELPSIWFTIKPT